MIEQIQVKKKRGRKKKTPLVEPEARTDLGYLEELRNQIVLEALKILHQEINSVHPLCLLAAEYEKALDQSEV